MDLASQLTALNYQATLGLVLVLLLGIVTYLLMNCA
jgi:hypothetical protein